MKKDKISIILPVYNGDSTLINTLKCIKQIQKYIFEIIIVNDHSSDSSLEIIKKYSFSKPVKIINHKQSKGLANNYNQAIKLSSGNIILIIHQDILFTKDSFLKLIKPFNKTKTIATSHQVILPYKIWSKFNFWQKLFFARKLDLLEQGIDGKFDAFNKSALIKIGLFDSDHFHSAGEDGDLVYRLKKIGNIIQTKAIITHIHQYNSIFSLFEIFRKQAQYSQAQGTLLRLGHFSNITQLIKTFFREILIIGLLIPYLNYFICILIFIYSIFYSLPMFTKTKMSFKHFLIPLINIFLLFTSFIFTISGFINKKQTI